MNRCARCFGDLPDLAVFCPHCAQAHEPDFSRQLNQTIQTNQSEYRINRKLSQGGLSTVFVASDLQTDQVVVIKVSNPAQLARRELSFAIENDEARRYWAEMLERMRREAEALAEIEHPNIVRFFGTGMLGEDLRFVVMEYLRGQTLRQEIDGKGRLELAETIRIAMEISSALSEVHQRGIIHRDLNPRNIFLDCGLTSDPKSAIRNPQSAIKLLDFGIAKFPQPPGAPPFTQYSVLSGTVAYASPEQCQSRALDHRTDLYSFGVVLYEMLTGQRPFDGRTPMEIALKQIQAEPAKLRALNPAIQPGLERAVLRALAKNPDDRQQSIEELATELRAGAHQIVIPLTEALQEEDRAGALFESPPTSEVFREEEDKSRSRSIRRRRRATVAAAAALVAVAAGFLLGKQLINSNDSATTNQLAVESIALPGPTASYQQPSAAVSPTQWSDPDSLELAAKLSGENSGLAAATPQPFVTRPIQAAPQSTSSAVQAKPAAGSTTSEQTQTSARQTNPQRASLPPSINRPQATPAPAPTVSANRVPPPVSQPDISQAPRREEVQQVVRREENNSSGPSQPAQNNSPHQNQTERPHIDRQHRDQANQIGPKLIQWSGSVNRERVIKIEMPGVPGVIEIPRVYRDRVGVVEPPTASNGWGAAVLRVFGKGNVSFLVRWWPLSGGGGPTS